MPIAAVGSVCTPLFMILMGVFQDFSLDRIGIPGPRTSDRAPGSPGGLRVLHRISDCDAPGVGRVYRNSSTPKTPETEYLIKS